MSKIQRAMGIGTLVMLAALGTGWTLEKAPSHPRAQGPAVSESTTTIAPVSAPAAAPDSTEEYDRSDLLLSQG